LLFVSYFPHLIAGPIIHHNKVIPQFAQMAKKFGRSEYFSVGLTILIIGLFKKVILADSIAPYADSVFDQAGQRSITCFEAWGGALAYALQIYLDFSAYSDMAIGISYMFGVRLPLNFYSPYKARNIVDFWRRWHISLSCFLRDYLYIPLGGNRLGRVRRHANLLVTMLLGGLWHGANWTFVVWGGLHGIYLVLNHMFQARAKGTVIERALLTRAGHVCSVAFTFFFVVVAWVYFRAVDMATANALIHGMFGFNGFQLPERWIVHLDLGSVAEFFKFFGIEFVAMDSFGSKMQIAWTVALIAGVFLLPNTFDIMNRYAPATLDEHAPKRAVDVGSWTEWRPTNAWLCVTGALGIAAVWALLFSSESKFIYFNF
jgi:D-alanyl-lipoteichoic acid acyltransferase DltB (MBOAT superfamily)